MAISTNSSVTFLSYKAMSCVPLTQQRLYYLKRNIIDPEWASGVRDRQNKHRRKRYADDQQYRNIIQERNRSIGVANKEKYNLKKKTRWATDEVYRRRILDSRKGIDQRESQLKVKYGINLADYERMLNSQNGVCAICGKAPESRLVVDHNHETGKIRGLLCSHCNRGLGCFGDTPINMRLAASYVEKHRGD